VNLALWALCEIAIAACDMAEVLGAAIGLNLLFHLPLLTGVLLTSADTLLILWFQSFGIRAIEAFVLALITVIGVCFGIEIFWAKPLFSEMAGGLVPRLNGDSLYVAIGILGATVMPHNLYLHSALVQTRAIGTGEKARRQACRYNLIDSVVALNGALLVNAAILVLAATVFFKNGIVVTEIQQAHKLLEPMLGTSFAGAAFAIALLCSGQSSTLTGTMAGQVVMEGFLNLRLRPWLRRFTTRAMAVIPAALALYFSGDKAAYQMLILSQVVLSMQLPFAVIPLVHFTSDRRRMGVFRNPGWVRILAWTAASIIVALNIWLTWTTVRNWLAEAGEWRSLILLFLVPGLTLIGMLLLWVTLEPAISNWIRRYGRAPVLLPDTEITLPAALIYRKILVPLDHSALDRLAVSHAAALARLHGSALYLLHVEEDVTSQVYGPMASTAEVAAGEEYVGRIVESLRKVGFTVESEISHALNPRTEIVRCARRIHPDLVVMGAHGHGGWKDLVFGSTIDPVRHELDVPVLVVRAPRVA